MSIEGLDVSKFQEKIDWSKVAQQCKFCFIRASYGSDASFERKFADHWSGANSAGLICGAYHYLLPNKDDPNIDAQADLFLATFRAAVGIAQLSYLPAAIDVEEAVTSDPKRYLAAVERWVNRVEADALFRGRSTVIYTRKGVWDDIGDKSLSSHPLWVADYSQNPPRLPRDWSRWTFFQYTDKGSVAGVSGNVDQDHFNGTMDDLVALTKPAGVPIA